MTDSVEVPDARKVDLTTILSGRSFPEDAVEVFMDEETSYEVSKTNAEIAIALSKGEPVEDLEKRLEDLIQKGADSRRVFHLRGIRRSDKMSIIEVVEERHPTKTDMLGRPQPNLAADELYTNLTWAAVITRIDAPGGYLDEIGEAEVQAIRSEAPEAALEKISKSIEALTQGSKSGFETIVKEHDFLSRR